MKDSILITIALPTYNRPNSIRERLIEIVPQLNSNFELLILDNASNVAISSIVEELYPEKHPQIRVVRNVSNIGLGANLCRCIEHAKGSWLWYVGDDDSLLSDALSSVKSAIEQFVTDKGSESCLGINLSTNIYQHSKETDVKCADAYWGYMMDGLAFGNGVFITSCILSTAVCRKRLSEAYNYAGTTAPHIAVISSALSDGLWYRFSPVRAANWSEPERGHHWNRSMIVANFLNLWSITKADGAFFHFFPKAISSFIWTPFIRGALSMIFLDSLRSDGFWLCYYLRLLPYVRWKRFCMCLALVLMMLTIVVLPFTKPIFRIALKPLINQSESSTEGLDRI